jgi:putative hydrolase of the HAD superfamily
MAQDEGNRTQAGRTSDYTYSVTKINVYVIDKSPILSRKEELCVPDSEGGKIGVVLFDYGGVLAEEGFREGLKDIARSEGLAPEEFFETARAVVYDSGYVTGHADEHAYWTQVRKLTGVDRSDEYLRSRILDRFALRPWMLDVVRELRRNGLRVGILSDQTQWLDELDRRDDFFKEFNVVFNSYHLGKGKKDPEIFSQVAEVLGARPQEILFVDDHEGNVSRAKSRGLIGIHYRDREQFMLEMERLGLPLGGKCEIT